MVEKIKKHMDEMPYVDAAGRVYKYGEFFPQEISPWAYNEAIVQEYFPLTKESAAEKKFTWRDADPRNYTVTLQSAEIPNSIGEVTDDGTLKFYMHGTLAAQMPAESLVLGGGAPVYDREYIQPKYFDKIKSFQASSIPVPDDL